MITLKMTPKELTGFREIIEDYFSRMNEETEALKRVLEALKMAEDDPDPEESELKVEMTLEDAEILIKAIDDIKKELAQSRELIKKLIITS